MQGRVTTDQITEAGGEAAERDFVGGRGVEPDDLAGGDVRGLGDEVQVGAVVGDGDGDLAGPGLRRVGEVDDVDILTIENLCLAGIVPVLPSLAVCRSDEGLLNVNADTAAAAVARHLRAEKLVFLTDTPGILRDRGDPVSRGDLAISGDDIRQLGVTGPRVGEILGALLERVLDDPSLNGRERLLGLAREMG